MILKKIVALKNKEKCIDYIIKGLTEYFGEEYFNFKKNYNFEYIVCKISTYNKFNLNIFDNVFNDLVADVICTSYKNDFYQSKLKIKIKDSTLRRIFLKALVSFEVKEDRNVVLSVLERERFINLDGIYNFSISSLKEKWGEMLFLANNNSIYFSNEEIIYDLLKFLMEQNASNYSDIHVYKNKDGYFYKDEYNNLIDICSLIVADMSDELALIVSLISLSPRRIFLHLDNKINEETYFLISKIFE